MSTRVDCRAPDFQMKAWRAVMAQGVGAALATLSGGTEEEISMRDLLTRILERLPPLPS